jgi:hypothetical protein
MTLEKLEEIILRSNFENSVVKECYLKIVNEIAYVKENNTDVEIDFFIELILTKLIDEVDRLQNENDT